MKAWNVIFIPFVFCSQVNDNFIGCRLCAWLYVVGDEIASEYRDSRLAGVIYQCLAIFIRFSLLLFPFIQTYLPLFVSLFFSWFNLLTLCFFDMEVMVSLIFLLQGQLNLQSWILSGKIPKGRKPKRNERNELLFLNWLSTREINWTYKYM